MKKQQRQQALCNELCRKILTLSFIFLLASCSTGSQIIVSGDVRVGMSKSELQSSLFKSYTSEDPFIPGGNSNMFYKENKEIINGSAKTVFYVFKNVTQPVKCGLILCENGNGYLEKWLYSYNEAYEFVTKKELPKVKVKKKIVTKDKDVVDALNKLIEDYKSGKINKKEFVSKKAEILQ